MQRANVCIFGGMNWHQQQALKRAHKLRNKPAHILRGDYIASGKTLCGIKNPSVYIDARHKDNPSNNCCKKCLRLS